MKFLVACFVDCVIIIQQIQGFIYQLNYNGILQAKCITNESDRAVAFIRNLYVHRTMTSSPVEYTPIIKGEKFTEAPCHLPSNCYNWMKPNYTAEQSLNSRYELPPVFDRRWNGFPEYVIPANSSLLKIFDIKKYASGAFDLSILALEGVQVVFYQDDNYNNVVLVKLGERVFYADGIKYGFISEIKGCTNFLRGVESCRSLAKKWHYGDIMMNGTAWNLFTFNYKSHPDYFELGIKHNSGNILDPTKIYHNSRSSAAWKVGARTINTSALLKIHAYVAIRPKYRGLGEMTTEVSVTSHAPKICLELTYFYFKKASNESISVTIKNSKKVVVTTANLKKNTEDSWKIEKVKTASLPQGNYSISVNIVPAAAYLGAINSCSNAEKEIVTSIDTNVIGCQLLGKSQKISGGDIGITELEAGLICGNSNCKGAQLCSRPDDCHCFPGYIQESASLCTRRSRFKFYPYASTKTIDTPAKTSKVTDARYVYKVMTSMPKFSEETAKTTTTDHFQHAITSSPTVAAGVTHNAVRMVPSESNSSTKVTEIDFKRVLQIVNLGAKRAYFSVDTSLKDARNAFNKKYDDHIWNSLRLTVKQKFSNQQMTVLDMSKVARISTIIDVEPNTTYILEIEQVDRFNKTIKAGRYKTEFRSPPDCIPIDSENTKVFLDSKLGLRVSFTSDDVCAYQNISMLCNAPAAKNIHYSQRVGDIPTDSNCQLELIDGEGRTAVLNVTRSNLGNANEAILVFTASALAFAHVVSFVAVLVLYWVDRETTRQVQP